MSDTNQLPPLPKPDTAQHTQEVWIDDVRCTRQLGPRYTADQMRAYAILALRPERVPMTEDQVWNNDALMSANGTAGFKMDALMRIVRAVEAHHGITAQPTKEGA